MSEHDPTTRPTLETIMDGINALRAELRDVREEVRLGFRRVERKIEVLNDELLELKASARDLEARMERLERGITAA